MTTPAAFADTPQLAAARELWSRGNTERAIAAFTAARQAESGNLRVRVEFARALAQVYEIRAAEQLLDEAYAIAGGDVSLASRIAPCYAQIYRPRKGHELLESVAAENDLDGPSLLQLALLRERFGLYDEAIEAADQVLAMAPDQPEVLLVAGRLSRRARRDQTAEGLLKKATTLSAPKAILAQVWSELSLLYDVSGDFAAAISAIEHAKAHSNGADGVERLRQRSKQLSRAFSQLYQQIDDSLITGWKLQPFPPLAEAAGFAQLIGFPRSGTTLIEQIIAANPGIFLSSERALLSGYTLPNACGFSQGQPFSLEVLSGIDARRLASGRGRHVVCSAAIEGDVIGGRLHLDKNPNHTSLVAGIYRLFPESKFVFVRRDPRDVIVSIFQRYFPLTEFSASFLRLDDLVDLYLGEMINWRRFAALIPDQVINVSYEDLVTCHRQVAGDVLRFLGVADDGAVDSYRDRLAGREVNSPSHDAVRRPITAGAVGRWKNYSALIDPFASRLEPLVKMLGYE